MVGAEFIGPVGTNHEEERMAQQPALPVAAQVDPIECETIKRIAWRLMPLLG
jgi:hypothetical protein